VSSSRQEQKTRKQEQQAGAENQEAGAAGRDRKKQKRLSNQFLLLLAAPASWFCAPILSALAPDTVDV
jgi:hypothetical protein